MLSMHKPIGIRREDKSRWERRAPLIPEDVAAFQREHGIEFIVQPSPIRVYPDEAYRQVGAVVDEDLSPCGVIFAIKEVPRELILPGKTYVFFSHTTKGQPHNMAMLLRLIEAKCQLIDYERVVDDQGRRLIFFGRQAGMAGITDTLWALGRRLTAEHVPNPFSAIRPAHAYHSVEEIKAAIAEVGKSIATHGVPAAIAPVVIGLTGYGNVSQGAQSIIEGLPLEYIAAERLAQQKLSGLNDPGKVYVVVFKEADMFIPKAPTGSFELQDYYHHPEKYLSRFDDYTSLLTVLVNCIYWDSRYPRLVTRRFLKDLFGPGQTPRLKVIGDISCDVEGSIEATLKATQPDNPVYVYDVDRELAVDGVAGHGPAIMAVDILPSELPLAASQYFSHVLRDYVPEIAALDFSVDFASLPLSAPLKRAMILYHGEFTPDYRFMKSFI